jgi:hypothetical protein
MPAPVPPLTFDDFERRVATEPDFELSWLYWNALLPETTGVALWFLFLWPQLRTVSCPDR